ncbi:MAG: Transporter, LysE family [uncultured Caballeronia sp.]|nr:MAG: Transporter, LysE family [uncultured Caballeronia sp.]
MLQFRQCGFALQPSSIKALAIIQDELNSQISASKPLVKLALLTRSRHCRLARERLLGIEHGVSALGAAGAMCDLQVRKRNYTWWLFDTSRSLTTEKTVMRESALLIFAAVAFIGIVTPGPTVLLALTNGSRYGLRRAAYGFAGAVASDFVLIFAVALGLGVLLAAF